MPEVAQEICFIRHETDYGPFFSSRGLAETYLRDQDYPEDQITRALAGTGPHIDVVSVTLDDPEVHFDG